MQVITAAVTQVDNNYASPRGSNYTPLLSLTLMFFYSLFCDVPWSLDLLRAEC